MLSFRKYFLAVAPKTVAVMVSVYMHDYGRKSTTYRPVLNRK